MGKIGVNLWIALLIAIASDTLDYFGGAIPIAGDLIDIATGILIALLGSGIFMSGLSVVAELIPFVDYVPTFTVVVLFAIWKAYSAGGESNEEKKGGKSESGGGMAKLVLTVVVLAAVVGTVYLIYDTAFAKGDADVTIKDGVTVVKSKADSLASGPFSFLKIISDNKYASSLYSWEGEVMENEENQDLGVRIVSFGSPKSVYYDGEEVYLRGVVRARSLKEGAEIDLSCELEDYDGDVEVEPMNKTLQASNTTVFEVRCGFIDPVYIDDGSDTLTARLKASFDFTTRASLKTYFITEERRDMLAGEDFFDKYSIEDSQLDKVNNLVRSQSTDGPLKVTISSGKNPQPFVEGVDLAFMSITFKNNWIGELEKINSFYLSLPGSIELDADPNRCDFEEIGVDEEIDGFVRYGLTPYATNKLLCDPKKTPGCEEVRDDPLYCWFKVNELPVQDGDVLFSLYWINLEMDYVYEVEASSNVHIDGGPGRHDACRSEPDIDSCILTTNCMPYPSLTNFRECIQCATESCGTYGNDDEMCSLDPCQLPEDCYINENGICANLT